MPCNAHAMFVNVYYENANGMRKTNAHKEKHQYQTGGRRGREIIEVEERI